MPLHSVFHKGNALALDGVQNDAGGLVVFRVESLDGGLDGVIIVAIDGQNVEIESLELFFQRVAVHDRLGGAVDLQMVAVQEDAEVGELVVGRKHERLPALALFHLAVAHDGVDADGLLLELGTQCHAAGGGDTLAQAAGGHIHARHRVHVGVALQVAADLTQGLQVFHREIAALGQSGVQAGGRVALGEHQTVTVRCFRIFRVNVHVHEIEVRQHLCNVQAAARMAALGAVGPLDHAHADVAGVLCQGELFCICHDGPPV